MSPVFVLHQGQARQLGPDPFKNEKELQRFFEANLDTLLGIRFVATEFSIGEKYGGRIDSLGLDESGSPVILEYKWEKSDSVISQGLFYLDWLVDHRGDFELAARKRLGQDVTVAWSNPRLILIAGNYSKYDGYGINRLSPNIELMRYRRYSDDVFVVENVLEPVDAERKRGQLPKPTATAPTGDQEYGLDYHLAKTSEAIRAAFLELRDRILALDGVEERANQKGQISYRTTKSFAAFDFRKSVVGVQFKGGAKAPAITGIDVRDIRSRQWGYPWMCSLKGSEDVDKVFEVVKSAYTYEQ
jgi:hypothetical protein